MENNKSTPTPPRIRQQLHNELQASYRKRLLRISLREYAATACLAVLLMAAAFSVLHRPPCRDTSAGTDRQTTNTIIDNILYQS